MKKRVLFSILGVFVLLAALGTLVLNGTIQLNHPSRETYPVRGVDVSHYQGEIDWKTLSENDIQFAFIKATEGSSYIDECFASNLEGALTTDLRIGAYHFFSYDSAGTTQAENFIANVPIWDDMLPPVIDVEFYGDYENDPRPPEEVLPELVNMLSALEVHYGQKPILYCTQRAYRLYIADAFDDYDLWIRNVYWTPNIGDRVWTFWQYTDRAKLSGYEGQETHIDMNVFYGSEEAFLSY